MEGTGITPVMDMNRGYGDYGFGGGSGIWLFAILALMWGGNGFFGRGGYDGLGYRAATAEVRSVSFDAVVRVPCCGPPSILTIVNSGVAITSSNIAVDVEYLD